MPKLIAHGLTDAQFAALKAQGLNGKTIGSSSGSASEPSSTLGRSRQGHAETKGTGRFAGTKVAAAVAVSAGPKYYEKMPDGTLAEKSILV